MWKNAVIWMSDSEEIFLVLMHIILFLILKFYTNWNTFNCKNGREKTATQKYKVVCS